LNEKKEIVKECQTLRLQLVQNNKDIQNLIEEKKTNASNDR